ncbi:MAG TPA: ThuA domain-containing protein [Caulobacteraceae bacterium]|nr:ThuA domain-containing protein [Caulobacteraceae bacterium]
MSNNHCLVGKVIVLAKWTAAVVLAAGFALSASAQTGNPGGPINDNLGEMDYGVCRGIDPSCFHNWPRPATTEYRVLLFTRTGSSRHADLGPSLGPGLNPPLKDGNVVQREMRRLMAANGIELDYTEDVEQLQAPRLNGYNAVIFFSTSRDILDDGAKTALRQYMRAGGGFVAIHNAFGTLYNWPYYEGLLGGANFYDHGQERTGDVVIVDDKDVSTKGIGARFHFKDEWYNLIPFPTHVRFLATVDEKSWTPLPPRRQFAGPPREGAVEPPPLPSVVGRDPGHGDFHPVAWCQYYDGGKVWATTLGHDANDFAADDSQFAGAKEFQHLIVDGIKSVMGAEPFCQ